MKQARISYVYLMFNKELTGLTQRWIVKVGHSVDPKRRSNQVSYANAGKFHEIVKLEVREGNDPKIAAKIERDIQSHLSRLENGKYNFRDEMEYFMATELKEVIEIFHNVATNNWRNHLASSVLIESHPKGSSMHEWMKLRQEKINRFEKYRKQYQDEEKGMEILYVKAQKQWKAIKKIKGRLRGNS